MDRDETYIHVMSCLRRRDSGRVRFPRMHWERYGACTGSLRVPPRCKEEKKKLACVRAGGYENGHTDRCTMLARICTVVLRRYRPYSLAHSLGCTCLCLLFVPCREHLKTVRGYLPTCTELSGSTWYLHDRPTHRLAERLIYSLFCCKRAAWCAGTQYEAWSLELEGLEAGGWSLVLAKVLHYSPYRCAVRVWEGVAAVNSARLESPPLLDLPTACG